jgi:hypothetical protein
MNTSNEKLDEVSVQKQPVPIGVPMWVQCEGYRCLAFMNRKGEWRAYSDCGKLTGVIKVLSEPVDEEKAA